MRSRQRDCAASRRASIRTVGWSSFLSADLTGRRSSRFTGPSAPGLVPTPPDAARLVFGDALPTAQAYAEFLAGPGVERGVLGPAEAERIWDRHLLNCAVVAELVPPVRELVDIGSGAGLPGVVLAMLLPQVDVVLVESMARRTAFLTECVEVLGLTNVDVRRGRVEDMAGRLTADVVTARAVARLDRLAVLAAGVAKRGGLVLALKGAAAAQELEEAAPVLHRLGASGVEIVTAGAGVVSEPTTVVRFRTGRVARRSGGATRARGREPGDAPRSGGAASASGREPGVRQRSRSR